ncbi:MAG: glycosyltransferase family 39 protein [Acidimicrobiales bacterium]
MGVHPPGEEPLFIEAEGAGMPDGDSSARPSARAAGRRAGVAAALAVWRSPPGQPRWARPALLIVAAGAGLSYAWGVANIALEPFYAAAARSMGGNWKDFFFGAFDPAGTVTLDKLPGAIWLQALSVRVFGFDYWAVAMPQVIAGILTVLVLYRAVRRVAGPKAGIVAALVLAASPVNALLNRGNVSDSVLVLLTVLAADAATRAFVTGRSRSLVLAGVWVGLAFQTKMVQAWLIVPPLFAAYLVAAPSDWRRRLRCVALAGLVALVVSLSWMSVVSAVPGHDRPYVDGTTDDSVFAQVFVYNGWSRIGVRLGAGTIVHGTQPFVVDFARNNTDVGTFRIAASPQRLLVGPLGRDDAWLLPAALTAGVATLVARRRAPRRDPVRAAVVLWGGWLVVLGGFFSFGAYVNSYYTAALVPAVAALCAIGATLAWRARHTSRVPAALLAVVVPATALYAVALVPATAGVRGWLVPTVVAGGVLAETALGLSLLRGGRSSFSSPGAAPAMALSGLSLLLAPAITTGVVVAQGLGSFSTPYQSPAATQGTTTGPERFQADGAQLAAYYDRAYAGQGIVWGVDTSGVAAPFVMVTGREFLPIGGFSGNVPEPTLAQLRRLIDTARLSTLVVPVRPPGRDPRVLWVRAHCVPGVDLPYGDGVVLRSYHC